MELLYYIIHLAMKDYVQRNFTITLFSLVLTVLIQIYIALMVLSIRLLLYKKVLDIHHGMIVFTIIIITCIVTLMSYLYLMVLPKNIVKFILTVVILVH